MALNWLVDNYARIAEWLASAGRVAGLWTAFSDLDASVGTGEEERITIEESTDENIHLDSLAVAQHDGKVMIDEADTTITAGEKVLLMGEIGTGKSTLIRAIAGLWPWGVGVGAATGGCDDRVPAATALHAARDFAAGIILS